MTALKTISGTQWLTEGTKTRLADRVNTRTRPMPKPGTTKYKPRRNRLEWSR